MKKTFSIHFLLVFILSLAFVSCERTDPSQLQGDQPDSQARETASAATVYDTYPSVFKSRLEALALGLIDPAKTSAYQSQVESIAQSNTLHNEHRATTESVKSYIDANGGNCVNDVETSAALYGSSTQAYLASTSVESFTVSNRTFRPVIWVPAFDSKIAEAFNLSNWNGISPTYITTTESFVNDTEMTVFDANGNSSVMSVEDVIQERVWIIAPETLNDDGSSLTEKLILLKYYCAGAGTNEPQTCSLYNSGRLCMLELYGRSGRLATLSGINDCSPNNTN